MKRLAKLDMGRGRIITANVREPISDTYYACEIVGVENPIKEDWEPGDNVKISKGVVRDFEFVKDAGTKQ